MPGGRFTDHVFGAMQPKEILRLEGPFSSFFVTGTLHCRSCCSLRAPALHRSSPSSDIEHAGNTPGRVLLGRCRTRDRPVPARLGRRRGQTPALAALRARALRAAPGRRLDRPHRPRPRAVMADLPTSRAIRRRLRHAGDGRERRNATSSPLRPAGRSVLRRRLHLRGRQALTDQALKGQVGARDEGSSGAAG